MARIAGVDLPRDKRLDIALTYIYGVGRTSASLIVQGSGAEGGTKVRDLSEEEVVRIRAFIDQNLKVEGDLRREVGRSVDQPALARGRIDDQERSDQPALRRVEPRRLVRRVRAVEA